MPTEISPMPRHISSQRWRTWRTSGCWPSRRRKPSAASSGGLRGQFDEVPFLWNHLSGITRSAIEGIAVVANRLEVILDWSYPLNFTDRGALNACMLDHTDSPDFFSRLFVFRLG